MSPARFVASGCGLGFAPFAPGTFGALLGLAIGAALLAAWPSAAPFAVLTAALVAAIGGTAAITAARVGGDDPGWVVVDEIAGQLLALLPLGRPTPLGLLAALALFRALDITKPGPIGWADRRHDAIGVMGDDLIAGAAAAILLWGLGLAMPSMFA